MPLHFADLGPSGLARRYGARVEAKDDAPAPAKRLEAARKAMGEDVTKPVTKPCDVTKPAGGRPALGAVPMTAAERKRASRAKAKLQP